MKSFHDPLLENYCQVKRLEKKLKVVLNIWIGSMLRRFFAAISSHVLVIPTIILKTATINADERPKKI